MFSRSIALLLRLKPANWRAGLQFIAGPKEEGGCGDGGGGGGGEEEEEEAEEEVAAGKGEWQFLWCHTLHLDVLFP